METIGTVPGAQLGEHGEGDGMASDTCVKAYWKVAAKTGVTLQEGLKWLS